MHAMEGAFKVFLEGVEGDLQSGLACDQDIVVAGASAGWSQCGDGCLQAAANAVAFDSAADSFSDSEAETRGTWGCDQFGVRLCLQDKWG